MAVAPRRFRDICVAKHKLVLQWVNVAAAQDVPTILASDHICMIEVYNLGKKNDTD